MAENDIVGVRVCGRYQEQNIVQTLHYKVATQTAPEHDTLQLLATAFQTKFLSALLARHIDTYTLVGFQTFSLTGTNKRPGYEIAEDPGLVAGVETPSSVCRSITLYCDSDNYRRRGRFLMSGCENTMFNQDDGAVTAAEITALSTIADLLIDPIVADEESWKPVLPAGTGVSGPYPDEEIKASLARRTPANIRSRRVKGFSVG